MFYLIFIPCQSEIITVIYYKYRETVGLFPTVSLIS